MRLSENCLKIVLPKILCEFGLCLPKEVDHQLTVVTFQILTGFQNFYCWRVCSISS